MRFAAAARFLAQLESVKGDPDGDGHQRSMAAGGVWLQPRVRNHGLVVPDLELISGHSVVSDVPFDKKKSLHTARPHSSELLLLNQKSSWEGVLRNSKKEKPEYQVEGNLNTVQLCDPELDEADVGLLSCGFNYYCAESVDSYLGGECVEAVNGSYQQPRLLQDGGNNGLSSLGPEVCDPSSPDFSKCDCAMFDAVSGNGYIKCLYYENSCLCPTLCFELHLGQEVRIPSSVLPIGCSKQNHKLFLANFSIILMFSKGNIQRDRELSLLLQFFWIL